jgi:hypothetical protein
MVADEPENADNKAEEVELQDENQPNKICTVESILFTAFHHVQCAICMSMHTLIETKFCSMSTMQLKNVI